ESAPAAHAPTAVSSTFVNHNSFAAYAGLGLIVACGMIFRLYEREALGGSRRLQIATLIEAAGQRGGLLVAGAFTALVALLLTGSRGGVIATGVGLGVLGALALLHGRTRGRLGMAVIALLVAVLAAGAALFAFGDSFIGGLAERGIGDTGRMAVYLI